VNASRWGGVPVLVTGAGGFIGSWLTARLVDEGARVVAPLRSGGLSGHDERVELTALDLFDPGSIGRVLNEHDVQVVFHLAAQTIAGAAQHAPHATFDVNVRGTYNVLEACRLARADGLDVRTVVASTYHVYGAQPGAPYAEDRPLRPRKPYEASKACADLLARSYAATYSMPVAVTRLANVYGGGDRAASRILPAAARALAQGNAPVIYSDGTPERDFIYAEDAVAAYLDVAESLDRPALWGRAWNAGADRPVAVLDIVRRLIAASGATCEPDVRGTPVPGAAPDRQYLDSSAIRRELGWRPRHTLDEGLAATYGWYASAVS
jgi:CDP-glucose 4,6-dehydratase